MKPKFYLIILSLFIFIGVEAQNFPVGMKYQAVARDHVGNILAEQNITLKITLYSVNEREKEGRNISYEEIHKTETNNLGLFSLAIGQGQSKTGIFENIPWSSEEIWMAVDVDIDGGNDFSIISESQLLAVPYAIHALTASEVKNSNGDPSRMNQSGRAWLLDGNSDTNPAIHFLGTIDNTDLIFRTNNIVRGRISNDGDFRILNNIIIDGNSFVSGNSTVQGNLMVQNNLMVANDGRIGNDLRVMRDLDVDQNGNIDGELYINDDLWVNGATDVNQFRVISEKPSILTGTLQVDGIADFNSKVNINDTLKVNNQSPTILSGTLSVDEATDLNDSLNVDGPTFLNNTFYVTGGNTSNLNGDLNVDGVTDLNDTLNVDGITNLNNTFNVTGGNTTNLSGNLNVSGATGFEGDLNVDGATDLGGTLNVDGNTDLNNTFNVTGSNVSNLTGTLNVDGITDLNNTLNVTGGSTTNLSGALNVDNSTDLSSTLNVDGVATFKSQVTFDITVDGDQTEQASYPVLIKGSKQGLAIDLTPAVNNETQSHRGNNYISFWRDGTQKGRIEGMGRADIDPNGMCNLFVDMISSTPTVLADLGTTYDPFSLGLPNSISSLVSLIPGELPDFTQVLGLSTLFSPGGLPSLNPGSLPSIGSLGGSFTGCQTPVICDPITLPSFPTISLNPGGLPSLFAGSLPSISNFDLNTILDKGALPGINFPTIQDFVDFSNPFVTQSFSQYCGFLDNFNGEYPSSPAHTLWTEVKSKLENSTMYPAGPNRNAQIYSNYTQDILQSGISATSAVAKFTVSAASSALDPDDIFCGALDIVVEMTNLTIYGAYADLNLGVAYESGAGDYAEWLLRAKPEEMISQGDIVGVIGGKISKEFNHADQFMVVSTAPLLLGNMPESAEEEILSEKIAFMGQVPVKVQGKVKIGDYILPSGTGDGLGIAVAPADMLARDYQRIVGVAWENSKPGKFINLINTAVGVNHNDMAKVVEDMQFTLNHIQDAIKKIDPSFVSHDYEVSKQEFQERSLDYNVSSTHKSKMTDYFSGKEYSNKKEMFLDVKNALVNKAGINLDDIPVLKFILENPEEAQNLTAHYTQMLEEMVHVRNDVFASPNTK